MAKKPQNPSAFPQHGWSENPETIKRMETQGGMTLRDYFAAKAMHGFIAGSYKDILRSVGSGNVESVISEGAYVFADAMLKQRSKS